jgi:hypothetical protein
MLSKAKYPSCFGWFAPILRLAVPPERCMGIPNCIRNDEESHAEQSEASIEY